MKFKIESDFTPEMDILRKECFPGTDPEASSYDDFDGISKHAVIEDENGIIMAYGRLTPNPDGVFVTWSGRPELLPNIETSIDFGRIMVNPKFRGRHLAELLILECLKWAFANGYKHSIGAVYPNSSMKIIVYDFGFETVSDPIPFYQSNGISRFTQLVVCDLEKSNNKWVKREIELKST